MLERTATHGWHGSLPLWCSCFGGVTSWWKDPSLRTEIQAGVSSPPPALCLKHPTIYRLCLLRWITPMCPPFSLKLSTSCCIHKGMMVYPDSGLLRCPPGEKNIQPLCKTSVFIHFRPKAENKSLAFHLSQCPVQTAKVLPRRWAEAWVELLLSVCVPMWPFHSMSSASASSPTNFPFFWLTEPPIIHFPLLLSSLCLSLRQTVSRALTQHTSHSDSCTSLCRYQRQFLYFVLEGEQLQ